MCVCGSELIKVKPESGTSLIFSNVPYHDLTNIFFWPVILQPPLKESILFVAQDVVAG